MMLRKRKGQSTLEYIIVFVAIVAAILLFAYAKLKPSIEGLYNGAQTKITAAGVSFGNATLGQ